MVKSLGNERILCWSLVEKAYSIDIITNNMYHNSFSHVNKLKTIINKNEIYTQWVKVPQKLISFHPETMGYLLVPVNQGIYGRKPEDEDLRHKEISKFFSG